MKKIYYTALFIIGAIVFNSCEENTPEATGIEYITFEKSSKILVIEQNSSLNTDIKVYTATPVSTETIIDIDIVTSLVTGTYTAPTTVTIPANSNEGKISLSFTETNYDFNNGENMSLSFNAPDGFFAGETKIDIKISVLCPIDLSTMVGSYSGNDNWFASVGGPLSVSFTTSLDGNTLKTIGLGHAWIENPFYWGENIITKYEVPFNINTVTGEVTIPYSLTATSDYLGGVDYSIEGKGTYSSCTDSFRIEYTIYDGSTAVGNYFGNPSFKWIETLTKN
jgi:hypothetical protein